jgi:bacillolysin
VRLARSLPIMLFVVASAAGTLAPAIRAQNAPRQLRANGGGADLRSWDVTIDRLSRGGELRRRRLEPDPLLAGRMHERLDQYYKGIRVLGADLARQTSYGSVVSVFGTIYEGIDLDVEPSLSPEEANAAATRDSGVALGPYRVPELLIYPDSTGYRLVYRTKAFDLNGGTEYLIDANDGAIVRKIDAVHRQAAVGTGTGVLSDRKKISVSREGGTFFTDDLHRPPVIATFDMRGSLSRTLNFLNGFVLLGLSDRGSDTDNNWTDGALVDAHVYAGYTYDYFFKRFGRRGLDNQDIPILNLVHPVRLEDYFFQSGAVQGTFYTNAGYYGEGVMLYGEGTPTGVTPGGQQWRPLAGGLDVVAHELTHGVTDYTSRLLYLNESGALNETFSDMMGTAVEFFIQPAGSGTLTADYLCGEDVVTPGGLRSMANPNAYGYPDHYGVRYTGVEDNGGVHINSSIGNHAYYLAIEGGRNRVSGITVQGVGRERRQLIETTVFRAFTQLMTSNTNFAGARAATLQAARDLYGANSPAESALAAAWTAVGVN